MRLRFPMSAWAFSGSGFLPHARAVHVMCGAWRVYTAGLSERGVRECECDPVMEGQPVQGGPHLHSKLPAATP